MTLLIANSKIFCLLRLSHNSSIHFTSHKGSVVAVEHDDEDECDIPEYIIFIYKFKTQGNTSNTLKCKREPRIKN